MNSRMIHHGGLGLAALMSCVVFGFLTGCKSYVKVRPYSYPAGTNVSIHEGLVYCLPKTLIDAKITYSVYREMEWPADPHGNPIKTNAQGRPQPPNISVIKVAVETPVELQMVTQPDYGMAFSLNPSSLQKFGVAIKDGKFEITEDGILASAGAEFQDKSLEAVEGLVKTGISLAKLAAVAKMGDTTTETKLLRQVPVRRLLELRDFSAQPIAAGQPLILTYDNTKDAAQHIGNEAKPGIPKVTLSLEFPHDVSSNLTATSHRVLSQLDPLAKSGELPTIRGIVCRVPIKARLTVAVDGLPLYDSYHGIAQAGGFAYLAIEGRRFSERKVGVTLSTAQGGPTAYVINATSAAAALAGSGSRMGDQLHPAIRDFEKDTLKAEVDRLKAEIELIKAKRELEDLQKR